MPDEHNHFSSDTSFSAFWPNLIVVLGFIGWFGIQDYQLNSQRSFLQTQLGKAQPSLAEAQEINAHSNALVNDLLKTAQTSPAAAQIIRDAVSAGVLHINQNGAPAGSSATPPPADPTAAPAK